MTNDHELKHRQRAMERDVTVPRSPTVTLNLDDLERKARAATQGRVNGLYVDDPRRTRPVLLLEPGSLYTTLASDCEHIAAGSPPVVLALIAEIRSLRAGQAQIARVFTGDAAIARIAKAATAFVDEQGKTMSDELLLHPAFATAEWEDLVVAVKAAGR